MNVGCDVGKGDRRHRAPPRGLPELAPVLSKRHVRDTKGRFQPAAAAEDASRLALTVRCQTFGTARDKEARRRMAAPHLSEPLGMVLERLCLSQDGRVDRDEVARLWSLWLGYTGAMRTYRLRILDRSLSPKGASYQMVHDRIEVDPDLKADLRTEAEKDEGAIESRRRWVDRLDRLYGPARAHLVQAESGMSGALWAGKAPTARGRATLQALRQLALVVEGER